MVFVKEQGKSVIAVATYLDYGGNSEINDILVCNSGSYFHC